jgi:hypothetical protein
MLFYRPYFGYNGINSPLFSKRVFSTGGVIASYV